VAIMEGDKKNIDNITYQYDWKYENIEVGQLILSKVIYFISGGILALVLAVVIAKREKKKKENEILAGWQ
jgi:biotin transporter BioY